MNRKWLTAAGLGDSSQKRYLYQWESIDQSFNPRIGFGAGTFTRASTGLYLDANGVYQSAAVNIPRFGYDGAGNFGLLLEGARTNVCLWNRDLTNAVWTASNVTVAKDQVGADGVAASASSLTATAGNGTVLQVVTLASSTRAQSVMVKRITGTGVIDMTTDGGATWTAITVTASYARQWFTQATVVNPSIGFRIVTSGDAIAVDYVGNETGAFPSSPMATTTVAVTRAADALSFPYNAVPQAMTVYAKFVELGTILTGTSSGLWDIGSSGDASLFCLNDGGTYGSINRTTASVAAILGTAPSYGQGTELRVAVAADGSQVLGQSLGGAAETTVTASANAFAPFAAATLQVGGRAGGLQGFALFQSIRIAAGVQTMTTMQAAV